MGQRIQSSGAATASSDALSTCRDSAYGYGWISILLHWATAIVIVVLWFLGKSIHSAGNEAQQALNLHTSMALCAWGLIFWRVARRFRLGHPPPRSMPRGLEFRFATFIHFLLLASVAMMLVSGPLMLWARGREIHVFSLEIAPAFSPNATLADLCYRVHAFCGGLIACAVLLHLAGTFKHVAFNRDETLERMLLAARADRQNARSLSERR